ncbi:hypothetical protein Tco_1467809 [Tanacetum coccineum]
MRPSSNIYNGKKVALKERYWIPNSDLTYDLERIRQSRPSHISEVDWDAHIAFWNDPKNRARLPKINKKKQPCEQRALRSDDKFSQMLTQLESQPEIGGGSRGSGGWRLGMMSREMMRTTARDMGDRGTIVCLLECVG